MSRLVVGIDSAHDDASAALVGEHGLIAVIAEDAHGRAEHRVSLASEVAHVRK